jgi:hypothetical protein
MKKKVAIIAAVVAVVVGGLAYAYTALTITSDVEVQEPISIVTAEGDGEFDGETLIWDIGEIYPLDRASLTITFANEATGPIQLSLSAEPASFDGGNLTFAFDLEQLVVPGEGEASVTLRAESTQSLAPGEYSTAISIAR